MLGRHADPAEQALPIGADDWGVGMAMTAAVLGSGSWGTALAVHLGRIGHHVRLWARDAALAAEMISSRSNPTYLPTVALPDKVRPTTSLSDALEVAGMVIVATPSHGTRAVLRAAACHISPAATIISATKGLEVAGLNRMSQVIREELGSERSVVVLSGPSFAIELARELPTAVVVASEDARATEAVQLEFRSRHFRLYASDDVAGVELGGAMKNVIAIAAGVVEGLGLGHNALAALITRGLAEISRLACAAGARRETLAGLSGLGDLVLTCTGDLSRNRRVGIALAHGQSLGAVLAGMKEVAEGVRTTGAVLALGERFGIEMPITTQMAAVLDGRSTPHAALEELMLRRQRAEADARQTSSA